MRGIPIALKQECINSNLILIQVTCFAVFVLIYADCIKINKFLVVLTRSP